MNNRSFRQNNRATLEPILTPPRPPQCSKAPPPDVSPLLTGESSINNNPTLRSSHLFGTTTTDLTTFKPHNSYGYGAHSRPSNCSYTPQHSTTVTTENDQEDHPHAFQTIGDASVVSDEGCGGGPTCRTAICSLLPITDSIYANHGWDDIPGRSPDSDMSNSSVRMRIRRNLPFPSSFKNGCSESQNDHHLSTSMGNPSSPIVSYASPPAGLKAMLVDKKRSPMISRSRQQPEAEIMPLMLESSHGCDGAAESSSLPLFTRTCSLEPPSPTNLVLEDAFFDPEDSADSSALGSPPSQKEAVFKQVEELSNSIEPPSY